MTPHPIPNLSNKAGFLRLKDVLRLYPVSKSTWWLGIQKGRYPKPVKLSTRISAWRVSDIQNLLDQAARQNALVAKDSACDNATSGGHFANNKPNKYSE